MMTAGVAVPIEALATLRRRLAALTGRRPQREALPSSTAELLAAAVDRSRPLWRTDADAVQRGR